MSTASAGIYQHYKGPLYQVLGLAHDANFEGRTVVLYFGLQLDAAKEGPRLAVRTKADFESYVHKDTGETCAAMRDTGKPDKGCLPYVCVERFRFRGVDFRAWMLE